MGASKPTRDYNLMIPDIKKCRDVAGGQNTLRSSTYLPQFKGETTEGYNNRVSMSYLNNKFMDKINESCGLILGKEIDYEGEDYIAFNTDGNGATLSQFALNTLKDGEIDGHSFILVDAPATQATSLAEQERNNLNPYWINVKAEDVINLKVSNNTLVKAVIAQSAEIVIDEFESEFVTQFKVYDLIEGKVWYRIYDDEDKLVLDFTPTDFKEIPLVIFYANKTGVMQSTPPFINIANLNINTFQLSSQKQRSLKIIGDPDKVIFDDAILQNQLSSMDDEGGAKSSSLTFGADIVQVFGTDSKYQFVEPTGKGVELLSLEIDKIEKNIDGLGAVITDRTNVSATEAEITNTKATASDIMFSNSLEYALNRAYQITGTIDTRIDATLTITLDRSFAKRELTALEITTLNTAVLSGNISKQTMLESISSGSMPTFATEDDINEELRKIEENDLSVEDARV